MIQFIDYIRHTAGREIKGFAFYCTLQDQLIKIGKQRTFDNYQEFKTAVLIHSTLEREYINRLSSLIAKHWKA